MPTDFKSFPDEISLDLISTSRFDEICYQDVKRKGRGFNKQFDFIKQSSAW